MDIFDFFKNKKELTDKSGSVSMSGRNDTPLPPLPIALRQEQPSIFNEFTQEILKCSRIGHFSNIIDGRTRGSANMVRFDLDINLSRIINSFGHSNYILKLNNKDLIGFDEYLIFKCKTSITISKRSIGGYYIKVDSVSVDRMFYGYIYDNNSRYGDGGQIRYESRLDIVNNNWTISDIGQLNNFFDNLCSDIYTSLYKSISFEASKAKDIKDNIDRSEIFHNEISDNDIVNIFSHISDLIGKPVIDRKRSISNISNEIKVSFIDNHITEMGYIDISSSMIDIMYEIPEAVSRLKDINKDIVVRFNTTPYGITFQIEPTLIDNIKLGLIEQFDLPDHVSNMVP